jgi:beta-glucosidase
MGLLRLTVRRMWVALPFAVAALGAVAAQTPPPYRDSSRSIDERVRDLVGRMTLEEKFWQLYMSPGDLDDPAHDYSNGAFGLQIGARPGAAPARAHAERINSIQRYFVERTRLGVPILPFDEALHGLMREGATVFPQAIALAATWDTALMRSTATAIAHETRSRGVRDVLSPVINIASDVRWGRVEETYGEDPFLTSQMARVFVSTFEGIGVVTTPKHLVANVGDGGRDSYPIYLSDRLLEEVHFPPFRASIAAGARSVMTAYNSVDGSPATQNRHLLTDVVKRAWDFGGFIISDAAATGGATVLHFTEANTASATRDAYEAGLDVVFQSSYEQHRPYLDAFLRGLVPDSILDAAVARVLRVKFGLGLFENPYVDVDSAEFWNGHAEHRAIARDAARAAIVLLRNERNTLPLTRTKTIAVIGADAVEARLGGYSGPGIAPVSILDGIRRTVGETRVRYAPGVPRVSRAYDVVPPQYLSHATDSGRVRGLRGEYWDNNRFDGEPRLVRIDARVDFGWTLNSPGRGIPFDWYAVRWTGQLRVPSSGVSAIGIEGNDGYRVYLDGALVVDNWRKQSYRTTLASVPLRPGSTHELRIEYFESTGNARVKFVWKTAPDETERRSIDSAVALARRSDVAVVVAGLEEGEFRDRSTLALPGRQAELIDRVAATGKPVVVVMIGGSAIANAPWIDRAAAIIDAWYPGEEGGNAVADVLFGAYSPAGRLPITFPMSEGQLPLVYNHRPTGRGDDYVDGTGQPMFPFGFGLSYTTFEYTNLSVEPATISAHDTARVHFTVRNTGTRPGDEVAQLYIRDILASVARPVMELRGFARVHLAPGESREIILPIPPGELRMLDRDTHWVVEPGTFRVMVGASSKDIRLRGVLTYQ